MLIKIIGIRVQNFDVVLPNKELGMLQSGIRGPFSTLSLHDPISKEKK
jgi:hypothetical protein